MRKQLLSIFALLIFASVFSITASYSDDSMRIAYYVPSAHWDREWYEPFQGFRMRLVSVLDQVLDQMQTDPDFKYYFMDGQAIPVTDYLEIRPEKRALLEKYIREGRFFMGPWYVLPDQWIVCGESIIRNLQLGMKLSETFGAPSSKVGFACDLFGHTGQMPQIFEQLGIPAAFVWRGTLEKETGSNFLWSAPDGTTLPAFRFSFNGYCSFTSGARCDDCNIDAAVDRLVNHTLSEAERSCIGPVLLFDGCDHTFIEPRMSEIIKKANIILASKKIKIVHGNMDEYMNAFLAEKGKLKNTLKGELRESGVNSKEDGHLIPGVLSSRIYLKQKNAACEDELCLWAEPFSTFATNLGYEYPEGFLRTSWKHLLENHPHDSICGCSIDQVHQDMIYRFDQSYGISSRLTNNALKNIALAAAPKALSDTAVVISVFNSTSSDIDEPVDIDIPLQNKWPKKFAEFFGYEDKYAFRIYDENGKEIPYQLSAQTKPDDNKTIIKTTASILIPAFGYRTFVVKPAEPPVRFLGSMFPAHNVMENTFLKVEACTNGTISVTDKRSGKKYEDLLTFEECADIGDGWFHGMAVNDRKIFSSAFPAEISIITDGPEKATMGIKIIMQVPKRFDFTTMLRAEETVAVTISSEITLRKNSDRIEVKTNIDNTARDHRIRVFFPTNLKGETYISDSDFDVVERPVALAKNNAERFELDVENRPQTSWTAFGDGKNGLAVISRGTPESSVIDTPERPLTLTLLRGFKRQAFFAYPASGETGQVLGPNTFKYEIVPFNNKAPIKELYLLGQRVDSPYRTVSLSSYDIRTSKIKGTLPPTNSFLKVDGNAVVTSVQKSGNDILVRMFNPIDAAEKSTVKVTLPSFTSKCVKINGESDARTTLTQKKDSVELNIPAKHITNLIISTK